MVLISFCFGKKVYFAMPFLFPETIPAISASLRANPRPSLLFRWNRKGGKVSELLGWQPTNMIHAEDVAQEREIPGSIAKMTEITLGGKFCYRGTSIPDNAMPSKIALAHRAMRAKIVYKFVAESRGMKDERGEPKRRRDRDPSNEAKRRRN